MDQFLVTGCSGYLGSVLVGELLNRFPDCKVIGVDNLMYGQDSVVQYCYNKQFEFHYMDVRDEEKLCNLVKKSDVIFPLAAIVGFPACDKDPYLAEKVNVGHIRTIVENLSKSQILILPQTNSGYGIGVDGHCTEENELNPITTYGKTKCEAEKLVLNHSDGISLRLATVFGTSPRMRLDLLVNHFTYDAVTKGYIVLFEKDFKRNYIHIRDVINTFIFMYLNYDKYKRNIFNVGLSDANLSKFELANKIRNFIPEFTIKVDEIKSDPDKRNYVVSNSKLESTGWSPCYSLDDGIQELIKAYKIIGNIREVYKNV